MKRALSIFLTCVFLLGLLPTAALALEADTGGLCPHHQEHSFEDCGYVEAVEGQLCGYVCYICPVQTLIDALPAPEDITADSRTGAEAQLAAIDTARAELTDEELEQLDTPRYQAVVSALAALDEQAGADVPMLVDNPAEQFPALTPGATYWFDLSREGIPGTVNTGNSSGAVSIPDTTLHWVPFTYVGTINAYSRTSKGISTDQDVDPYDHSLFIADYNVTHTVYWNDLNNKSMIFGTNYTSGGVGYTLRAPATGSSSIGNGDNERGTPQSNEWDMILNKDAGYIKNWSNIYSWGQDTSSRESSSHAVRGYAPARFWNYNSDPPRLAPVGFRPVLEILNPNALTSGISVVTLNLNGGKAGTTATAQDGPVNIVVKSGESFAAPSGEGLSAPEVGKAFGGWEANGNLYLPGVAVSSDKGNLTAVWVQEGDLPKITIQPVNASVPFQGKAEFSIDADGDSYQWQTYTGSFWKDISNATDSHYTIGSATMGLNGSQYRCVVTNNAGSVISDVVTLTVQKLTPIVTPPTKNSGLIYSGTAQALISAGYTTGGTLQYSLSKDNGYSTTVPTGTSAGNYTVYYKVVGNDNYNDVAAQTILVTIAQKSISGATVTLGASLTYTGQQQTQTVSSVTIDGLTATYTVSNNQQTDAETYTLTVTGTGNFTGSQTAQFTIDKATPTPDTPSNLTAIYGQTLANVALPSGWAWNAPTTFVGNVGDNSFPATYTHNNSGNYNTVPKNLTVTVSAAPRTITVTGTASSPTQITLNEAVIDPSGTGGTVRYGKNTTNIAPSTWQEEREFSGLTADTPYYFFAKVDASGNYAEAVSAGVAISTPAKAVSNIAIANQPTTLRYTSDQTLDLSGLSVTVNYNDGTNGTIEWVSGTLTADPAAGTVLTVTGHNGKTVTVSYGGATAETSILTVTQGTQATASITGAPATIYNGDSFTLTLSGGSGAGAVTWEIVSGPATVDATTGKVTVTGTGEIQIKAVKAADTDYTQTEATITLNAVARPSPPTGGGGGGTYTPPYPPTVEKPGEGGGTPTISPSNPKPGDAVTVKPKPDEGYEVDKITVTDKDGKPVEVTVKPDGTYTFKQPNGKVTVKVTYRPTDRPWNNPFTDVSEGDWYYEAVRFVQERGLMNGYSDGRFGPNDNLSRAQLAQILFNKEGRPGVNYLLTFSDVAGEAWYTEAIRWAASQGIVSGYGNGTFGPNDPITREQLAVMLWRYSGSPAATDKELHFNDTDEISGFALEAMRWAVEQGILQGKGGGILDPTGKATRAEVAAMLQRFCEKAGR